MSLTCLIGDTQCAAFVTHPPGHAIHHSALDPKEGCGGFLPAVHNSWIGHVWNNPPVHYIYTCPQCQNSCVSVS